MQLDYYTYKTEDFTCPKCGWQGKGAELEIASFSEVHSICHLECPKCDYCFGHWQAPLMDEK